MGPKSGKKALVIVSVVIFAGVFLCLELAMATEGGGHGGGKLEDLLYRVINFSLLVIILFVALRKPIKNFFSRRKEEIKGRLESLNREKATAEKRYLELEEKLKEFEKKKQEIIEQFKSEGLAEKEKIIAEGRERVAQILEQADRTVQLEFLSARDRLRKEIVEAAAEKAQEILISQIKESDQDQLVDEFIKRVEKLH